MNVKEILQWNEIKRSAIINGFEDPWKFMKKLIDDTKDVKQEDLIIENPKPLKPVRWAKSELIRVDHVKGDCMTEMQWMLKSGEKIKIQVEVLKGVVNTYVSQVEEYCPSCDQEIK